MQPTIDALVALAYSYCPKAPWYERGDGREERARVLAAGRRAGAMYEDWREMHRRILARLPARELVDHSVYLLDPDGCTGPFWATLFLPRLPNGPEIHKLVFFVSVLVPYYVMYSARQRTIPGAAPKLGSPLSHLFGARDAGAVETESLELSADEQPYADVLAAEIERTFGYERMPPEIGKEVVPDVVTGSTGLGTSTLYDCLFLNPW